MKTFLAKVLVGNNTQLLTVGHKHIIGHQLLVLFVNRKFDNFNPLVILSETDNAYKKI